jgi:hypothetical protein
MFKNINYGFYVGAKKKFFRKSLNDNYIFNVFEYVKDFDPSNILDRAHSWADFHQYDFIVGPFSKKEMADYFCRNPNLSANEIERRFKNDY